MSDGHQLRPAAHSRVSLARPVHLRDGAPQLASRHYYVLRDGASAPGNWIVYLNHRANLVGRYSSSEDATISARIAAKAESHQGYSAQVHVQRFDGRFRTDWIYGDEQARHPADPPR